MFVINSPFLNDANYGGIFLFLFFLILATSVLLFTLRMLDGTAKTEGEHFMQWKQDEEKEEEGDANTFHEDDDDE